MSPTMTNTVTRVQMDFALIAYKRKYGRAFMHRLLLDTAGASAISDVPYEKIAAVFAATKSPPRLRPGEQIALTRLNEAIRAALGGKAYPAPKPRAKP